MHRIVPILLVLPIAGCMDSAAGRIPRAAAHQALVDLLQTHDGQTTFTPRNAELLLRELRQDGATLTDLSGSDFMDAACHDVTKNEGWAIDLSTKRFRYHVGRHLFGGEFKLVNGQWIAEVTHQIAFCH